MYALLISLALAQPVPPPAIAPPTGNAPGGSPPEQVMASIDAKGKLTIVHISGPGYGPAVQENTIELPAKKDEKPTKVKVKVSSVVMTTTEMPAKIVQAYTVAGTQIEPEKLAKLLAKEKTVLLALDGKKVDPALLQLYKDDTIILVPPANAVNLIGEPKAIADGPVEDTPPPPPMGKVPEDKRP